MELKTFLSVLFFSVIIFILGMTGVSDADDLAVCPTCYYTKISEAVAAAVSGEDRVVVGTPGRTSAETYIEDKDEKGNIKDINLKSGVDLVSEGDDTIDSYDDPYRDPDIHVKQVLRRANLTIIEGTVKLDGIFDRKVTLDGFTIKGSINIRNNSPLIKNNIVYEGSIAMQGSASQTIAPEIDNNLVHDARENWVIDNEPWRTRAIGNGPYSNAIITNNECWGDQTAGIGMNPQQTAISPVIRNNYSHHNNSAGIGSSSLYPGSVITIQGNYLYQNSSITSAAGIRLKSETPGNIRVDINSGNRIYNNSSAGIVLEGLDQAVINSNDISSNNYAGINLISINQAVIDDNNIYSNGRTGIYFYNVSTIVVNRNNIFNHISHQGAGIYIESTASHVTIGDSFANGNDIYDNISGIHMKAPNSQPVLIKGNYIHNNSWGGLSIIGSTTAKVTITENNISQNGRGGISIANSCSDLEIKRNNIYDNLLGGIHTGAESPIGAEFSLDAGVFAGTPGSAVLTIRQNKVNNNGINGYGSGIDVRHASGVIYNNLVYKNHRGGIRYGDYITEIINNTVVDNGSSIANLGGGIIYDDLDGDVNAQPEGSPSGEIPIKNNISVYNRKAGFRDGLCSALRDYNLIYGNFGQTASRLKQLAKCDGNANEIFADPLFVDRAHDDYRLQADSPAVDAGDSSHGTDVTPSGVGTSTIDMGAYGGPYAIDW